MNESEHRRTRSDGSVEPTERSGSTGGGRLGRPDDRAEVTDDHAPLSTSPISARDAAQLVSVDDPFVSCDECFRLIDDFVDAIADDAVGGRVDDPLRTHLGHCVVCLEEAETLVTLVADDRNLDAEDLLDRLRLAVLWPPGA